MLLHGVFTMNNTENQSQHLMSVENANESLLKKRRDFIKRTSVAVPVVLTLRSGSVLAAVSASCDAKLKNAAIDVAKEKPISDTQDIWLRSDAVCVKATEVIWTTKKNDDGTTTTTKSDGNTYDFYGLLDNTTNQYKWYKYNETSLATPHNLYDASLWTFDDKAPKSKCYILQHFDSKGNLRVIGPSNDQSIMPLTTSCVTSLVNLNN